MSENPNVKIEVEPVKMKVQNIQIVVRQIQPDEADFFPRWRKLLSLKRVFSDFEHAQPEDVDEAINFLADYITAPENRVERVKLLNKLKLEEIMNVFDAIQKGATVPPVNGGA